MSDYLNRLKNLNMRPNKIKVKENTETILMEVDIPEPKDLLNELFIQMDEISNMTNSPRKDMAILRLACIAEYDAVNLYEKMASETNNTNIKKVLLEIANEEKAHIGEFEYLLENLDSEHEPNKEKGEEEVVDLTGLDSPKNNG